MDLGKINRRAFFAVAAAAVATVVGVKLPQAAGRGFGKVKFIGKSYILDDHTMYVKRESYRLEFFAYETRGGCFPQPPSREMLQASFR
jgi:hypothetical protein